MFPRLRPPILRTFPVLIAFVVALFFMPFARADGDGAGPRDPGGILSRRPYLQSASPTGMVVVWRTLGNSLPILRYGTSSEALNSVVFATQMVIRLGPDVVGPPGAPRLHSAPMNTYQYEAYISGLAPDSLYYYAICDGETLLAGADADHRFRTLPAAGTEKPLRFWVVGDSGDGSAAQISGFTAMRDYVAGDGRPVDHYLHLGDMAYGTGLDIEFQLNFFGIYGDLMRNTVTWPTMGNHEGGTSSGATGIGPYYDAYVVPTQGEAGGLPTATEAYYSFDIGKVHLICLDSHDLSRHPTGAMAQWLQADLEQTNAEWLLAFWHHPPYTKGTHDSDTEHQLIEMRQYILPILEASGVDLVLAGHSHIYERSMLIDGAYTTPTTSDGVVIDDGDGRASSDGAYEKSAGLVPNEGSLHVVSGHGRGGASYYGFSPVMRETIGGVGSVLLDVDGDTLTGRMIDGVGAVRDVFELKKSGALGPREPLEYPWNPGGPYFRVASRTPGSVELEIRANPPAPDAVLRYTLDASEPIAGSTVFSGPVEVPPGTLVRASSEWRNGERTSPVGSFVIPAPPQPPVAGVAALHIPLASPADEAVERVDGSVLMGGKSLSFPQAGAVARSAWRFEGVRVPPGALVTGARISFETAGVGARGGSSQIGIEGEISPDEFSAGVGDLTGRAMGAGQVPWTVPAFFRTGQPVTTPDLSRLVSGATGLPGWTAGGAMVFLFSGDAEGAVRGLESSWTGAATLSVNYYKGSAMDFLLGQSIDVRVFRGFPASRHVSVDYVRPLASAGWNVEVVMEESGNLKPGEWKTLETLDSGAVPIDGTVLERVTASRAFPAETPPGRLFLRLRVSAIPPP